MDASRMFGPNVASCALISAGVTVGGESSHDGLLLQL